ncbi:hypothetical protein XH80_08640 [Bradyrhizobium sp. CCBAU 45384]|nr:hypothetical protein [Bradyrhizobium sp. CCBAU 45384]
MALWNGSSGNDLVDWSTHPLDGTGDTGHAMYGFGGDDQIKGSDTLTNIIDGGTGNDRVIGGNVSDILLGGDGNDEYQIRISDAGIDTVADDLSASDSPGLGGGTSDYIHVLDSAGSTLMLYRNGNDLLVTNAADAADGAINSGASIYHFFLGGNNVIEYAIGSDGNGYNLTTLLSPSPSARPALTTEHAPVSFDGHELQQVHALPLQHDLLV